ncbi:hypothetical protein ON010_g15583 [Phytophthora cinnamomi]|nr:hypothetical protein ON010_g15583 [Phytophthora cinnamomi]
MHPSKTPYELSFKVKLRLGLLREFGSLGYGHVDKAKRTKVETKSFKYVFLGYAEVSKGYQVNDLESYKLKVSRSVKPGEREMNGIYDTASTEDSVVIQVTKDVEDGAIPEPAQQLATDKPMEVMNPAMSEEMAFHPEPERFRRLLNGLKLAANAWHMTIHRVFVNIGYRGCGAAECVYVKGKEGKHEVKVAPKTSFKMKGLGEAEFILGMEVNHGQSANTLMVKHTRYMMW